MLQKFDDFKSKRHLDNEREAMERELRARKTQKNNMKFELDINLDLIKDKILHSIETEGIYVLTLGKRIEELEQSKDALFHIEFESEDLGRVRIIKPKDNATKGYYDVNGDVYETDVDEIRKLYHILNQEVKGEPIIERKPITTFMTPVDNAEDIVMGEITSKVLELEPESGINYEDTIEFFETQEDDIMEQLDHGFSIDDVFNNILESIVDKMKPKSEKELEDAFGNVIDELADKASRDGEFEDYYEALEYFDSDDTRDKLEVGHSVDDIYNDFLVKRHY